MARYFFVRVGVSASAIGAVVVALALPAGAHGSGDAPLARTEQAAPYQQVQPNGSECVQYDQSADLTGLAIVSQNFESTFDQYDSQGVDNFAVTSNCHDQGNRVAGSRIQMSNVTAFGVYFNGSGPADSFNVTLYKNRHSTPGAVVKKCDEQPYTYLSSVGGFQVDLAKRDNPKATCVRRDVRLRAGGVYWVSVQANLGFTSGGEWGWDTVNPVSGAPAMWENPGDGLGTGCTTYTPLTTCFGSGGGRDLAFQILR